MQPVFARRVITASVANHLLADFPLSEFAPGFGIVQCAFNISALGAGDGIAIWTQQLQIYNALVPLVKATSPTQDDDFLFTFPIGPGERLVIDYNEAAGATPTLLWAMRYLPA